MRTVLVLLLCVAWVAAEDAVRAAMDSVVGVQARRSVSFRGRAVNVMSRSVGIVVGKNGLILTSSLGDSPENVRIFRPGTTEPIEAEVLDGDEHFTVLRASGLDQKPVTFRRGWRPKVGDKIRWVGILAGATGRWTPVTKAALVNAIVEDPTGTAPLIYSDPPFNGPVSAACALILDQEGEAIGIMVPQIVESAGRGGGRRGRQQAMPFVRPTEFFAHHLTAGGAGGGGVLGVTAEALGERVADAMGLKGTQGVLVTQVTPGSGAAAAGVLAQDVITSVAGMATADIVALYRALRDKKAGDEVVVELTRLAAAGAQRMKLTTTLTAKEKTDKSRRLRARRFGFVAEPLTDAVRRDQALPEEVRGLHVRRVTPGSPAALARPTPLRKGDVILKVGEKPIVDLAGLREALKGVPNGTSITLFVRNRADTRFVDVRPEAADG